jgi:3-deoxy-D-manno-octulosonic-acid transferase
VSLLYDLFLYLYRTAIAVTSLWNKKAQAWHYGRKGQWTRLDQALNVVGNRKRIWMHCASLGEFEQGRPILEALKGLYPDAFIVLSFFSPSGYEVRKGWEGADLICYLPMDGVRSSRRFLDIVDPSLVLFIKYEFWHYYLKALEERGVPTVLVSGAFRKDQPFFQAWGGFFRKVLSRFTVITVQDAGSEKLLNTIGLGDKTRLTGDTRYDRVGQIANNVKSLPLIETFKGNGRLIVAGSTWPEDERMLKACLGSINGSWKLVIAPHEIDAGHLNSMKELFGDDCVFYSSFQGTTTARVLVIDNIGMLSSLYSYGEIACIGGGYNKSGIHNVLEPAVFGLPVIMGPEYEKFPEAVAMVKKGFAIPAKDAEQYAHILRNLMTDGEGRAALQSLIRTYIREHAGATAKILALLPQAL